MRPRFFFKRLVTWGRNDDGQHVGFEAGFWGLAHPSPLLMGKGRFGGVCTTPGVPYGMSFLNKAGHLRTAFRPSGGPMAGLGVNQGR